MSDAQHTPGPWRLERNVTNYRSGAKSLQLRSHDGISLIATFPGCEGDVANARLIAAAPDLLDACRKALYALKGREHDQFLRDAITKATGSAS